MFGGNVKVEKGVKLMNSIEDNKFPLLLNRITQSLSTGGAKPFTEEEQSKLESSLEISKTDVQSLIEAIIEIFQLCAYYLVKPAVLQQQLESVLKLDSSKTDIFVQAWTSSAKNIVDNLKQTPFLPQLNHIAYAISVEAGSDVASREKVPKAQLELGLSGDSSLKEVNLDLTHSQLFEFYQQLEQIQGQLDALR